MNAETSAAPETGALTPPGASGIDPTLQFVVEQANITLDTLVRYEAQYVSGSGAIEIQRQILRLSSLLEQQYKKTLNAH